MGCAADTVREFEVLKAEVERLGLAHVLAVLADVCEEERSRYGPGWGEWEKARLALVRLCGRVNV